MERDWSGKQRAVIVAAAAILGVGLCLSGDKAVDNLALIFLGVGAAGAVAWLAPSKPVAAFGILFLVAALSGLTISTRLGNMRLEQPAIVAGFAALLLGPSRPSFGRLRPFWPIGAAFGLYIACLGLSSVLFAPDRADSLRMTFWTGLSMSGGLLAFLLLARGSARATEWILASGYFQAIVGIVCAVLFFSLGPVLFAGPAAAPGVTLPVTAIPKIDALSWEANIYASLLAALTILGLSRFMTGGASIDKFLVPVMAGAIALGVTRGAYLGLAVGTATYVLYAVTSRGSWVASATRRVGVRWSVLAASVAVGVLAAAILMQGGRPATKPLDFTRLDLGRGPVAVATGGGPAATPATPAPGVFVPYQVAPDTVTFRIDRIPVALADLPHSLLIGLGANSFGQRHADVSQGGAPDHIAILALAAVYEAGLLGAAGLGIGFALLLLTLFMAGRKRPDRGPLAAYAGAIVCLLVAYETTNALNFVLIWLIAGAGLAAAAEPVEA